MVGRFIQQQHIRIGKQRLGQQHTQLPAGSDFAHRAEVLFQRNTQAKQQFSGTGFCGVTVHFGELTFEFADFHTILFAHFR